MRREISLRSLQLRQDDDNMRYHVRISIFPRFWLLGWLVFPLLTWGMDNEETPVDAESKS